MQVYFIQVENGGPIKIGKSKNPARRLLDLQVANPYKLKLLFCDYETKYFNEEFFHRKFRNIRMVGEWFMAHKAIVNVIKFYKELGNSAKYVPLCGLSETIGIGEQKMKHIIYDEKIKFKEYEGDLFIDIKDFDQYVKDNYGGYDKSGYFNIKETAYFLGMSRTSVHRLITKGELKFKEVLGVKLISQNVLDDWIENLKQYYEKRQKA